VSFAKDQGLGGTERTYGSILRQAGRFVTVTSVGVVAGRRLNDKLVQFRVSQDFIWSDSERRWQKSHAADRLCILISPTTLAHNTLAAENIFIVGPRRTPAEWRDNAVPVLAFPSHCLSWRSPAGVPSWRSPRIACPGVPILGFSSDNAVPVLAFPSWGSQFPGASFPSGLVPAGAQLVATTGADTVRRRAVVVFCKWSKPSRNLSTANTFADNRRWVATSNQSTEMET